MSAYYNENDPVAAEWLRRLIARGLIAPGEVDERDIRDVAPADLLRFTQCHFFAGIGLWSLALRRAGWGDDRPIWTGSCPCQPFSAAGAGDGFNDERHLWPHWHWLIEHCRPSVIAGEQVAGQDGLGWNDLVSADLDGIGYASGAIITSAAGFGMEWRGSAEARRLERAVLLCPDPMVARHLASFAEWADQALGIGGFHIRERQYFVGLADRDGEIIGGRRKYRPGEIFGARQGAAFERSARLRSTGELASGGGVVDRQRARLERLGGDGSDGHEPRRDTADADRSATPAGPTCRMADGDGWNPAAEWQQRRGEQRLDPPHDGDGRDGRSRLGDRSDGGVGASPGDNRRGDLDWPFCRDGKWRPVGPGSFPLAAPNTGRVGRVRAYGNGLDLEAAAAFCESLMAILADLGR